MNNLIIGIAGGSGSGKTTLALRLKERFGEDEVRLISHDSYYKRHDELPFEERCKLNYDHPDAFDNALLIYHLQELKAGRAIDCPVYDYSNHNRSDKVQHIEPAPVLIVEGILPFVEPRNRNADIIVPNGGENTAAVEMLAHHIRNLIEKAKRKSYLNFGGSGKSADFPEPLFSREGSWRKTAWAASASFGKRRRAFKIIPCKTKGTHSRIAAGAFLYTGFSG